MSSTSRGESFGESESERRKKNEGKKKTKKTTKKKYYYAVARGRTVGVYDTWDECNAQVRAYPGASHKVIYRDTFCCIFPQILFPLLEEQQRAFCVSSSFRFECDAYRANEPFICSSDDPKKTLLFLFDFFDDDDAKELFVQSGRGGVGEDIIVDVGVAETHRPIHLCRGRPEKLIGGKEEEGDQRTTRRVHHHTKNRRLR